MDSSRFLRGFSSPPVAAGIDLRPHQHPHPIKCAVGSRPTPAVETAVDPPPLESYMFPLPLRRLWPGGDGGGAEEELGDADAEEGVPRRRRGSSWVMNILRVRSLWARVPAAAEEEEEDGVVEGFSSVCGGSEGCAVEEEPVAFDGESFSRLLRRVSVLEAELYKRMLLLSHLAYSIPKIKPSNLLKFHGLRFITSSLEKNAKLPDADDKEQTPAQGKEPKDTPVDDKRWENSEEMSPSDAYQVAASAASYLQSLTRGIPPFGSAGKGSGSIKEDRERLSSPNLASFVATTNSMTAVVAGKEEMKQAVAKDLNSALSSPCEWFICDDDSSSTRHFVIQGSESLASWQANLLFEPIQFEELDVLVHRGIYEAAKGIYQQMLPEIRAHLRSRGNSSSLRFTGHSLGGSLALLVNLMLLIRGDAPASSLLPVITFGAPSIMCGGDYLLRKLGLPQSHVHCITMHRDIVPRAFSCNYPDHVARILTAVNENFRNHPCLKNQKHLYTPMGKLLILQPDEKLSPHHHLLPKGAGLYLLDQHSTGDEGLAVLRAAQSAFLNSPHPLEILSDRTAYGSEGTVLRDHDVSSYLRSVRGVIRHEIKLARKAKGGDRRKLKWTPLVGLQGSVVHRSSFATLNRFGSMVASQHVRMFLVLLVSARMLLMLLLGALPNFS